MRSNASRKQAGRGERSRAYRSTWHTRLCLPGCAPASASGQRLKLNSGYSGGGREHEPTGAHERTAAAVAVREHQQRLDVPTTRQESKLNRYGISIAES